MWKIHRRICRSITDPSILNIRRYSSVFGVVLINVIVITKLEILYRDYRLRLSMYLASLYLCAFLLTSRDTCTRLLLYKDLVNLTVRCISISSLKMVMIVRIIMMVVVTIMMMMIKRVPQ